MEYGYSGGDIYFQPWKQTLFGHFAGRNACSPEVSVNKLTHPRGNDRLPLEGGMWVLGRDASPNLGGGFNAYENCLETWLSHPFGKMGISWESPIFGVKIKNTRNHHLGPSCLSGNGNYRGSNHVNESTNFFLAVCSPAASMLLWFILEWFGINMYIYI